MTAALRAKRKASGAATGLAVAAVLMVLVGLGAAFVPAGGGLHHIPPVTRADPPASSSPSASPAAKTSPVVAVKPSPVSPRGVSYAAPRVYPAPAPRTYPAPARRTYPAPSPRTYPPPSPSPPPPPGWDLPPPAQLVAPLEGVVSGDPAGFDAATGTRAQLVASYVSMASPLAPSFLHSVMRVDGSATPVIEIEPPGGLAGFPSAADTTWLKALAGQIAALARPVWISFAPEADGSWYPWGQNPRGFIVAWKQVRQAISSPYVTWLWQMSALGSSSPTNIMTSYWPGSSEVDIVGLDGYLYAPGDTFARRFGSVPTATAAGTGTLGQVRAVWGGPVIIAETAVSPLLNTAAKPAGQAAGVTDLVQGVGINGLLGLVYFDLDACTQGCGPYKQDFRLESNAAALAAFTAAVSGAW